MTEELEIGHQLNVISEIKHPMLIASINNNYIEVIALDKTAGKMHQLYHNYNYYINSDNPNETVIYEDSYAQLNTKLTITKFNELKQARRTTKKLSSTKLANLLKEYKTYQEKYGVAKERIVHMTRKEIILLNPDLKSDDPITF